MAEDKPRRQILDELKQPSLFRTSPELNTKTSANGDMELPSKSMETPNGAAAVNTVDLLSFFHLLPVEQILLGPNGHQHSIPIHWRPTTCRHEARSGEDTKKNISGQL